MVGSPSALGRPEFGLNGGVRGRLMDERGAEEATGVGQVEQQGCWASAEGDSEAGSDAT
jgi:hypothetical protein